MKRREGGFVGKRMTEMVIPGKREEGQREDGFGEKRRVDS